MKKIEFPLRADQVLRFIRDSSKKIMGKKVVDSYIVNNYSKKRKS